MGDNIMGENPKKRSRIISGTGDNTRGSEVGLFDSKMKGLLPAGPSSSELPALVGVQDSLPMIGVDNLDIDDGDWGLDKKTQ